MESNNARLGPEDDKGKQARDLGVQRSDQSEWRIVLRELRANPTAYLGSVLLAFMVLVTVLAPLIAPYDPIEIDSAARLAGPSPTHWFGTDNLGRDVLTRVLYGGQESLCVAVFATVIAMVGGVAVGMTSGYFRGMFDEVVQRIVEVFYAFPTILLLLTIVATLGASLSTVLIALAISTIPYYSRIVRSTVLKVGTEDYVLAARVIGAGHRRVMLRHILPNILRPILVLSTPRMGFAILMTAGLSYIGLGSYAERWSWVHARCVVDVGLPGICDLCCRAGDQPAR